MALFEETMNDEYINLDYYYGQESEQFSFFRIPKLLVTDQKFCNLSSDTILLYGMLLDRMSLSQKNKWVDDYNRVYIIYTLEDIMHDLNKSHGTVVKAFKSLDQKGLIERIKQGQGKPTLIYVKNFAKCLDKEAEDIVLEDQNSKNDTENPCDFSDFQNLEVKTSKKKKSRLPKTGTQDFQNLEANNTEYSYTNSSDIEKLVVLLRARDDKKKVENLIFYVEEKIGKQLDLKNRQVCQDIISDGFDPELVGIAIEDNLFLEKFNMSSVIKKLRWWKKFNINDAVAANNDILDAKWENTYSFAIRKAKEKNPYMSDEERKEFVDQFMERSEVDQIRRNRDYLIEKIKSGASTIEIAKSAMRMEADDIFIVKYLPKEIQESIRKMENIS